MHGFDGIYPSTRDMVKFGHISVLFGAEREACAERE